MKIAGKYLLVAFVAVMFNSIEADEPKSETRPLSLDSERDLFTPIEGDRVSLETTNRGKMMRWTVSYANKQLRACTKDVAKGSLTGMGAIGFRCRADAKHQLWIQLNEESGEKFYKVVDIGSEWEQLVLPLDSFTLNEDKVVNRRLDTDQVTRIVLLDFAALSGKAKGSRTLWFADFAFSSSTSPAKPAKPDFFRFLKTGKVGMTCVPRDFRETESQWVDLLTKANDTGVQVLSLQSDFWAKQEAVIGKHDFKSWDNFFAILKRHEFNFELSKDMGGPFFLDKVNVPKDIRFKSFSDPVLLDRYAMYVTSYLDRFGQQHAYIVIHAEGAEKYFARYPDQLDDYCRFLLATKQVIKRHSPHIKVGVNTDTSATDEVLSKMAAVTDFMAYDVVKGKVVQKPSDFATLTARLISVSNGKKIAFQNAGWSTSKTDNSSDAEQVAFIREFFRVLNHNRDKIEYASFGAMYDHNTAITGPAYRAVFSDLPSRSVEQIIDSMSHFGLFRSDGTAKPGWTTYRSEVMAYYR